MGDRERKKSKKKTGNVSLFSETGAVKKEWGGRLSVLLVSPNSYRAGMSNLAVHTVYSLLNGMNHIVCERCFWQKGDGIPLSIESGKRISSFSVIAFSVSFQDDYINVVDFLRTNNIEMYAARRTYGSIVMAGGIAVTLNPEPIADFMDVCIIGEAEFLVEKLVDVMYRGINSGQGRGQIFSELDQLNGVYIPSLYKVEYKADGTIAAINHKLKKNKKVKRHIAQLSDHVSSTVIYTNNTTFSGMHLLEVARGCAYRCRFCISGYAYLPPRYRQLEDVKNNLNSLPAEVKRVGIISPMITDYPYLAELLGYIHRLGLKVSMSSMRADSLALLDISKIEMSGDQFSAAIAPEAGTYRLRKILNKRLTDEQIIQAVKFLARHNVHILKLYFLMGISTETDEDISAIAELALQIKRQFKKGRVIISINPLIPKPLTPFQWLGAVKPDAVRHKLKIVKNRLKGTGIKIEWEKHYLLQAILSGGDRRLADFLVYLSKTDKSISRAIKESGVDVEYYAFRQSKYDEILPWDFMDYGFSKRFLWKEYNLGMKGVFTPPCRIDACRICGICGVKT